MHFSLKTTYLFSLFIFTLNNFPLITNIRVYNILHVYLILFLLASYSTSLTCSSNFNSNDLQKLMWNRKLQDTCMYPNNWEISKSINGKIYRIWYFNNAHLGSGRVFPMGKAVHNEHRLAVVVHSILKQVRANAKINKGTIRSTTKTCNLQKMGNNGMRILKMSLKCYNNILLVFFYFGYFSLFFYYIYLPLFVIFTPPLPSREESC